MWYNALLLVHILAGIAWLGGGIVIQVTQRRAFRSGGRPALDRVRRDQAWTDTWLAIPAPLLVVGSGAAMVVTNPGWRFSQVWVWMAVAIVVLYEGLAFSVGARIYQQVESGVRTPEEADPGASLIRLGDVLLVLLVAVVSLMVFKPL